ncbi:CobW family GTP-binding protein [Neptuniibacter sp. QD37_6]|uniref:CobW family GTP-binding protein n=1 Tax=Neptuniibacter sp. QD37_6 TaxID=3398210 RepID=UPI0039F4D1DE
MSLLKNIPTNIITGFLGTGKTTALNHLLTQKPEEENWAILVNEFGQIGIDQAALTQSSEGVNVKELVGGCICCTLGPSLTSTLATLLRQTKPDRLIIEPTGIGHPAGIVDTLKNEHFKDVLELHSIICLVDPRSIDNIEIMEHPTFQDQINLADVIVLNKTDLASAAQITTTEQKIAGLYPAKQKQVLTTQGQIDSSLLDITHRLKETESQPQQHKHLSLDGNNANPMIGMLFQPRPKEPFHKGSINDGLHTMGWIFNPADKFSTHKLEAVLQSVKNVDRIKGVFNTDKGWNFFNQVGRELSIETIAYRRDNRIEVISQQGHDWSKFEQQLLSCIIN